MKPSPSNTIRSLILLVAFGALVTPAALAGPMNQAARLTQQAHDVLKNEATADKGGHRVAAMKLLKQAVDEINAGIEFDKTHVTGSEGKKRKQ